MPHSNVQKKKGRSQLSFWSTPEEIQALEEICEELGVASSEIFRIALEKIYTEVKSGNFKPVPTRTPRPKDKFAKQGISA